jgi:hypothetical protein
MKFLSGNKIICHIQQKYFCLILFLLINLLNTNNCRAFNQIDKQLNLVKGSSYELNFDEKITKYSLGNSEAANIEIISSIFRSKQDVIIKTLKETETNLLIWTKDDFYNFNVTILPSKTSNISVITNIKDNTELLPANEEQTVDTPPDPKFNIDLFGFEIDKPARK